MPERERERVRARAGEHTQRRRRRGGAALRLARRPPSLSCARQQVASAGPHPIKPHTGFQIDVGIDPGCSVSPISQGTSACAVVLLTATPMRPSGPRARALAGTLRCLQQCSMCQATRWPHAQRHTLNEEGRQLCGKDLGLGHARAHAREGAPHPATGSNPHPLSRPTDTQAPLPACVCKCTHTRPSENSPT